MKLISKFKDFYDFAFGPPIEGRLFKRETLVIKSNLKAFEKPLRTKEISGIGGYYSYNYIQQAILFFCGKTIPVFTTSRNLDEFSRFMTAEMLLPELLKEQTNLVGREKNHYQHIIDKLKVISTADYITEIGNDIFITVGVPYFLTSYKGWRGWKIEAVTLPLLDETGFSKIYNAQECYQEIDMFLSNVLTEPDLAPLRVGSDELIAKTKGFDEMSFRTMAPGTKKLNRQANRERKRNGGI